MGVKLTPLVVKEIVELKDLRGKSFAVDASNTLYQFLTLIRMRDGTPLSDSSGRITSHLVGLLYRTTRMIADFHLNLTFVFDGKPPPLKDREIERRRDERDKAMIEWRHALAEKDYGKAFSKAVISTRLESYMIEESKYLLELLGIPYVQAPSEGEAQSALMAKKGVVWAVSSMDYDSLLFGAPRQVRYLTISGRLRNLPTPSKPEIIELERVLGHLSITREQLIDLAILIGTDYNPKVKGIGPKTALKLLKKYQRLEDIPGDLPENFQAVRELFLNPKVKKDYSIVSKEMNEKKLFEFLCEKKGFDVNRVNHVIERMRRVRKRELQKDLFEWF